MDTISRRAFLKHGAIAGTVLYTSRAIPQTAPAAPGTIRYRALGSTGWQASEIGFGAMNMRDPELVRAAFDAGINYFDTADGYMNGVNEEVLGAALAPNREKVFITTKVNSGTDPARLERDVNACLKRLRTDYIDALLLHGGSSRQMRNQQCIDAFGGILRGGKVRFAGVSTHSDIAAVLDSATESKFWQIATLSYNYTSPREVTNAVARARASGMAIVAMKTLNKGRGSARSASPEITPNQAALKYVLQNRNIDTTIPGMTSFEHLTEDMAVMKMELSSADRRELERYGETLGGAFCSGILGCTACESQCPKGVSVREINRCLGYAYGYRDIELAQENYRRLPAANRLGACLECGECAVKCVHGLDLNKQIRKARSLFC